MRKVTFGAAVSLDNFIAGASGDLSWLLWSDDVSRITGDYWRKIDAILMGRKTFETSLEQTGESGGPSIKTYVFSRTLKKGDHKNVELVSENAAGFVRDLKNTEGGDICLMGGGDFAKTLFEAGLVDEVGLNVHPVLLGRGVPLFLEMETRVDLELIECRPLEKDCVYVLYKVG